MGRSPCWVGFQLNAQEQWELFVEFRGLPNPAPVYDLDVQRQEFTKRPTQARPTIHLFTFQSKMQETCFIFMVKMQDMALTDGA